MINELHRIRIRLLKRERDHWKTATGPGWTEAYRNQQIGSANAVCNVRQEIEALLTKIGEEVE